MRQISEFYPRLVEVYICEEGRRRLLPFFVLHESPTSLLLFFPLPCNYYTVDPNLRHRHDAHKIKLRGQIEVVK